MTLHLYRLLRAFNGPFPFIRKSPYRSQVLTSEPCRTSHKADGIYATLATTHPDVSDVLP